jgi:hypothetical protein
VIEKVKGSKENLRTRERMRALFQSELGFRHLQQLSFSADVRNINN